LESVLTYNLFIFRVETPAVLRDTVNAPPHKPRPTSRLAEP
jgi:hypothetical protein